MLVRCFIITAKLGKVKSDDHPPPEGLRLSAQDRTPQYPLCRGLFFDQVRHILKLASGVLGWLLACES